MNALKSLVAIILGSSVPAYAAQPNFVVLLVDDAALMDFSSYGGEAHTPNIDRLAAAGVSFSNYHTSPMCAPSRAMLLTGLDSHRTGVGTLPETITEAQQGQPAYALHLLDGVQTIADRLGKQGYQTYMTGKWHLGEDEANLPNRHGFERSFALAASGADNWEDKSFLPFYPDAPWYEDGKPARLPDDFYSSRFLIDRMVDYLDARDRARPFFSYVAFQAIHIPVQAPAEFTNRYEGVYTDGWDALRTQRFERAKQLGLVPPEAPVSEPHESLRAWEQLDAEQKLHYEDNMMVNAGMLEAMDHYIGRLLDYLKKEGELASTVFVVTSDNGPEPGDPPVDPGFKLWMKFNGYHSDHLMAGEAGYMGAIGAEWASAAATPGALFKMYAAEGGTRVPFIVSGSGIAPRESFHPALTFVTDIAPTIMQLAGQEPEDMDGRSLVPLLNNSQDEIYADTDSIGMEMAGNTALFQGDFKLTRNSLPFGDGIWRLHNLRADPAEQQNLSEKFPELYRQMLHAYEQYAEDVGVVALPADFDIQQQVNSNVLGRLFARNQVTIVGITVVLFLTMIYLIRIIRTRQRASGGFRPSPSPSSVSTDNSNAREKDSHG